METVIRPDSTVIVIFGVSGDLTWRKLVPALYDLHLDGYLPEQFAVIGVDSRPMSLDDLRQHLREGVAQHARGGKPKAKAWQAFAEHIVDFLVADLDDPSLYRTLSQKLAALDKQWQKQAVRVFYQALPPTLVETLVRHLREAGLAQERKHTRLVLEKPFGWDLDSACQLNALVTSAFDESQIYRIDHYLGKETVQNILAFRFANALFEPLWDRKYIDHVQISLPERLGIEHRGDYYDHTGALRDMVQSHVLQVLSLVAMDPPVAFEANEIRDKKVEVLRAVRPISPESVHEHAARGQYGPGWIEGEEVVGYRQEPGVEPDSSIETYAALKLFIDNWRWQDVPFYMRTGKRLDQVTAHVSIVFRPVPHQAFPASAIGNWQPNCLTLYIQPDEGIRLGFYAKRPGQEIRLTSVDMHFSYYEAFRREPREAYETLLLDVMQGDATLFKRADQTEASWAVIMPILEAWQQLTPDQFPDYPAGSAGPESAEVLIARDGRSWLMPPALPHVCPPPDEAPEHKP